MSRYPWKVLAAVCWLSAFLSYEVSAEDVQYWDAREDFIPFLDQEVEPNDPWTYRSGNTGPHYGNLLVWKQQGQWGQPASYTRSLDVEDSPILGGQVMFTCCNASDPENEQIGGHGSWMVRWESPIEGWVRIDGYIYQTDSPKRLTNWKLLKNGEVFTEGYTAHDAEAPIGGYESRVAFDTGNAGVRGTFVEVEEGDVIDYITPSSNVFGENIATAINSRYRIVEVEADDVPERDVWDSRVDFVEALDQSVTANDPWSYRDGTPGESYGDVLVWDADGFFGEGPVYATPPDGIDPPIVAGHAVFLGTDWKEEQIGGYGPWMIRWASPFDGWIHIEGYIYQVDSPDAFDSLTSWSLSRNDVVFSEGLTAFGKAGPINGLGSRVSFDSGNAGRFGTFVRVFEGDTIDLVTAPSDLFGGEAPAPVNTKYLIRRVQQSDVPAPEFWDVRLDFADNLDQSTAPNLPWTYRNGTAGAQYGELLVWNPAGALGQGPSYSPALGTENPPLVAGHALFGGSDPLNEQVGGHGSWMLRWTSPVAGWVQIQGYIYQTSTPNRLTNWQFLKNGAVFTQGFTASGDAGPLNGYDNRVSFDTGSGAGSSSGRGATFVQVTAGDTIDFITPGSDRFGDDSPTKINSTLKVVEVPAPPVNVTATALNSAVQLVWESAPDSQRVEHVGYHVLQTAPGPVTQLNDAPLDTTAFTVTGLPGGAEHCFSVESLGANGRASSSANDVCATPIDDERELWDARGDFVANLDQTIAPNLPWTYRDGHEGERYGNLLVWKAEEQWGQTDIYTASADEDDGPVIAGHTTFSGEDPNDEEISGHGSWLIRWTSPIEGLVQVTGFIYQTDHDTRLTNWKILKNNAVYTEGFTAHDELGPILGRDNRVSFESGSGGLRRTYFSVRIGDTLDFLATGNAMFGDPTSTAVHAVYRIRKANPEEVPVPTEWDVRRDFVDGLDQTTAPNLPWTYRDGNGGERYGRLLIWKQEGQWGQPPSYTSYHDINDSPLVGGEVFFTCCNSSDPEKEQFGGHGPWLIRWTSPFDGEIEISGYIYQSDSDTRLTQWLLFKNDLCFTDGFTAFDEVGPLGGYESRVFFSDGFAGADGLVHEVAVGDTIDFVTRPDGRFGEAIGTGNNAVFTITRLDVPPEPPEPPVGVGPFIRGDCDGNGAVGGSPTEAIVLLNFSFRGGTAPQCLAACDAEANGSIGITDALRILRHAFLGVGEPDPPFPDCVTSAEQTDLDLGCAEPSCAP